MKTTHSLRTSTSFDFLVVLTLMLVLAACGEGSNASKTGTIRVSLLIHTGDHDSRWFQDVEVQSGSNAYELTEKVTGGDMKATYYPEYRSHSVDAIFGVKSQNPTFWGIWLWNETASKWEPLPVGPDLHSLKHRQSIAWYYADTSKGGNPPPITP